MNLFVQSIYISSALSLGYIFLLYRADPFRRLPGTTVTLSFVIGMLGVIPVELIRLILPLPAAGGPIAAFVTAGAVEEGVKFVLMGATIWRFSFPDLAEPIDLSIYFGTLGLGFGVYEDFWYIFSSVYPAWSSGDVTRFHTLLHEIILARALPGHILFDALAGFLIGYARFPPAKRRVLWSTGAFLFAVGLHGVYNMIAEAGGTIPLVAYVVLLVGAFLQFRKYAVSRSPFRALIELVEGRTNEWRYPRPPIEYLFATGFYWPEKPRGGMFQAFPLVLSLIVLYPLLFGIVYLINTGLVRLIQ